MAKSKVETLDEHIKNNFYNQADFARQIGTSPQHVVKWKVSGYIVVDGVLCKKMRNLKTAKS